MIVGESKANFYPEGLGNLASVEFPSSSVLKEVNFPFTLGRRVRLAHFFLKFPNNFGNLLSAGLFPISLLAYIMETKIVSGLKSLSDILQGLLVPSLPPIKIGNLKTFSSKCLVFKTA